MSQAPFESAFERDPDLDPIRPPAGVQAMPAAAEAGMAGRPSAPGPKVAPADPSQWSVEVPLAYPVTVDGVVLSAIKLRRVTGKEGTDLLMQDDDEQSINRRARGLVAGVHPDVLDGLWADDALAVLEAIRPFLPRALQGADLIEIAAQVIEADPAGVAA